MIKTKKASSLFQYYHYEHIPSRGAGHAWRVGDMLDNFVQDFGSEKMAEKFVKNHNKKVIANIPNSWRF